MFFTHLAIGHRLALVFGLVIAVFLAIAAVACVSIQTTNSEIDTIVNRRQPAARRANELKAAVGDASRSMANVLVSGDAAQVRQELEVLAGQLASQDQLLAALAQNAPGGDGDGSTDVRRLRLLHDEFMPAQAGFVRLVASGDRPGATAAYLTSVRPVQVRYLAALRAFAWSQDEKMRQACQASAVESRRSGVLVLGLALAAAFVSAWVGLRVVRSIAPAAPGARVRVPGMVGRT